MSKCLATALALSVTSSSCSTLRDSMLLGATSGALAGGGMGFAMGEVTESSERGAAIGAVSGAIFGALFGFLAHKKDEAKAKEVTTRSDGAPEDPPALTRPIIRRSWVPDRIEGDRYEKGHWQYHIETNAQWRE